MKNYRISRAQRKIKTVSFLLILFLTFTFSIAANSQTISSEKISKLVNIEQVVKSFSNSEINLKPFEEVVKNKEKSEGLFTIYKDNVEHKIYLEIKPNQLQKNYLCVITLNSGIGEGGLLRGLPLQDLLFYFHRVQNNVHFVIRNVNFRTRPGDPLQRSLDTSFSDSVLYSLPIKSIHPERQTLLIDLGDLLMGERDISRLTAFLPWLLGSNYIRDPAKSYFGESKVFPLNLEIESVYGFTGGDDTFLNIPSLPDNRGFTLRVNYSFSEIPTNNGYRPRLADERVGYFVTAYRDFSDERKDPFMRYINRWHLEKQNPSAPLSPPKEPIVFWIENTVPVKYRDSIREGILMWNKAFEKAGFINAIEVRQMPDDATWDPADIRYNTIRWTSSFETWFLGVGPSRVNSLTGQILDADIILDANVIRIIKGEYRSLLQQHPSVSTSVLGKLISKHSCIGGMEWTLSNEWESDHKESSNSSTADRSRSSLPPELSQMIDKHDLCYAMDAPGQLAVGAMALYMFQNVVPSSNSMQEFVHQYLRLLTAHEIGHTLGLRHNFHGSTLLTPEQLHDRQMTRTVGLTGSVMDYLPVNLAPPGKEQGDYFSAVVGPYDQWAIEYGYKPIDARNSQAEWRELQKIAQRSGEPGLSYAADEDSFDILDPAANVFDLSSDMLLYSQWQMDNARELWERLNKRYPATGEGYSEIREKFDTLFLYYFRHAMNTTLYIGGQSFNRNRAGDFNERLPFEQIPVEKQRQALQVIQKYVFEEGAFNFPPELLNKLAPDRWYHWGTIPVIFPLDYPIGDRILLLQRSILYSLLSSPRLTRLRDQEIKTQPDQALTLPELFNTLKQGIWTEVLEEGRDNLRQISSIRRSLQREHLNILGAMVLRKTRSPEDARTLAWYNLRQLQEAINDTLGSRGGHLDIGTKAHLEETNARITQILQAQLQSN